MTLRITTLGEDIGCRLEENNIITNYQAPPNDNSFVSSSGIRMGAQEMTRFGMKEHDFIELAGYIADCVKKKRKVREQIKIFRNSLQTMQYCTPIEKAAPLAARVLTSIFPDSTYILNTSLSL